MAEDKTRRSHNSQKNESIIQQGLDGFIDTRTNGVIDTDADSEFSGEHSGKHRDDVPGLSSEDGDKQLEGYEKVER